MVRAATSSAAPSELSSAVSSSAQARLGASSANGLPAASTPVNTPVAPRNCRRSIVASPRTARLPPYRSLEPRLTEYHGGLRQTTENAATMRSASIPIALQELLPRSCHHALRLGETFSCGGLQRPFPDVLIQHLDPDRPFVADRPHCLERCGDIEFAVAGKEALIDH